MPVTPFHLGVGLVAKALLRGSFSLMVFAWSQVLMDLQPIIALTTGKGEVHGWSHTWIGAIAIGAVATVTGKPLADWVLRLVAPRTKAAVRVSWWVAAGSAFFGTLSHIVLDGFMHSDLHPFAPWSETQPWLGSISYGGVYLLCVVLGTLGAAGWIAVTWWRSRSPKPPNTTPATSSD